MFKRKEFSHQRRAWSQTQTSSISSPRFCLLAGISLIVTATFLAYLPSLSGGFIFDDDLHLTNNPLIQSSNGIYQFWTAIEKQVWPLSNASLWLEWRLWGLNPIDYHITNLLLHIVDSLLLWVILRKMSIPGAYLAALLFAVHPVNVESVAWIAQRKGLLAMSFLLLSILCYLKFELPSQPADAGRSLTAHYPLPTAHQPLFYWLSLLAFILAVLSKGTVVVLPVLLLGIIWWLRRLTTWDLVRIAPFFLIAAVLTCVNLWFQSYQHEYMIRNVSFTERLLGAGGVVWFYLYQAVLPLDLAFLYPQWHIQAGNMLCWLPLAAALVVTGVLLHYRQSWSRPFWFAWGFFCVSLIPVLGFADVGYMQYSLVADHYQHIAIIAAIALAAAAWGVWHQRVRGAARWSATFVAVMAVAVLTFLTWRQSGLYGEPITLYQTTLKKNPESWLAHVNLGVALAQKNQFEEAIEHFQKGLLLKPDNSDAHNNLGNAFLDTGRVPEAIQQYEQALRLNPDHPDALYNLGHALAKAERFQEAIESYQQALKLKPDLPNADFYLAIVLAAAGRFQEAEDHYQQVLRLKPDHIQAHNNLGGILMQMGQTQKAIKHFQQVLRLKPDSINARINLALAYSKIKHYREAVAVAEEALELARSTGQTTLAKQIENSLNSYRAGLAGSSTALPTK